MSKQFLKQISRIAILNFLFIALLSQLLPAASSPSSTSSTSSISSATDLLNQLSQHNKTSDCWIVVGGHLYDITTFFGSHPGGDALLSKYCGTDATQAYDTKNLGPGQAHSGDAQAILAQYLIQ